MSIYDYLEFRHLKYIVAIAEEGTFTAAAHRLPVAQSALSRQIGEIEEFYGIQIFDRTHGRTRLTATGETLLSFARQMLEARAEFIESLKAVEENSSFPFKLGFSSFIDNHLLGTVCQAYRNLFPHSYIQPEGGDTEDILEQVKNGTINAALVTLPVNPEGVHVHPIIQERLVVCIRKDDSLAELAEIPSELLSGKLSIFSDPRHHPRAHARLLEMLSEHGITPRLSNATFNAEHVQWMVREQFCLALIREKQSLHDDLTTRPIKDADWTLDSAIVYRPEQKHIAIPLLLRDLERRFPLANARYKKRSPLAMTAQTALFPNDTAVEDGDAWHK